MNLSTATFTLTYNNKDITSDIAQYVLNLSYTDKVKGESDELEITLEDSDGRWMNGWYPDKKAKLNLIIRQGYRQLDCGSFELDEVGTSGSTSGSTFTIKALAAGISKSMRTKRSYAHEDKSLREIANTVAASLGLTLQGTVENIVLHRQHQYRETDLGFLNRIGSEYGYVFSVRGSNLIFTYYLDLENRAASLSLSKQQLTGWDLKDTTNKTFKAARTRHHNPLSKEQVEYVESLPDETDSEDDLELHSRVENKQQAEAKTKHALHKANTAGVSGTVTTSGNLLLLSGNNVSLPDMGVLSGTYHIEESRHAIDRDGGYVSDVDIKRVKK